MTSIVGVRVRGVGAVIASDGQVSNQGHTILKTDYVKIRCFDTFTVGVAGDASMLNWVRQFSGSTFREFRTSLEGSGLNSDFELLVYDALKDRLMTVYHQGATLKQKWFAAIGSGSPYMLGALEMVQSPKTLEEARDICEAVIGVACKLDAHSSGKIRTATTSKILA